jgi:hypothetical protein
MHFSFAPKIGLRNNLSKVLIKIMETIKEKSPSVETERPLTIACHMKKSLN